MFKVVVTETVNAGQEIGTMPEEVKRFEQSVDELNLRAVIAAVNSKPRKPRAPKPAK